MHRSAPDAVVDLHVHSDHSDGADPPAVVVEHAREAGLDVVALTDHDVVSGWAAADAAGRAAGVTVVPGVEVSCSWRGISVHLLAYLPDPDHEALAAELEANRRSRDTRLQVMIERLRADGYPVSEEEVRQVAGEAGALGRPHVADVLVRQGVVASRDEAFAELLSSSGPYYVSHAAPDPVAATEMVVAAGGVAVLAHPFAGRRGTVVEDRVVADMAEAGMLGLEVDHRDHGPQELAHAADLAGRLGLLRTGSSDYHGAGKQNRLGEHTTDPRVLDRILEAASGGQALGAPL